MNWDFIKAIGLRFLRVFVSAGLARVLLILSVNPLSGFDPETLKNWVLILITAFITGGLAALDKAIRFKE